MHFFKDCTLSFLRSADDDRVEDIIIRRYALNGHKKHTLENIGDCYGLSKERIRQIESKHLRKLKSLMKDLSQINQRTLAIEALIEEEAVLPKEKVMTIFGSNNPPDPWELFYLDLLGIAYFEEYDIFHTKTITRDKLIKVLRKIRTTLKENTIPTKRTDLFDQINFSNLSEAELDTLTNATGATLRDVDGMSYYHPFVDDGWSAGRLAHLILWENNEVMTTDEILNTMKEDYGVSKSNFNIVNQMGTIGTIKNIDLHTWSLTEWGLKSNYVIHVMEDVLRENNQPMTTKELVSGIRERRSGVLTKSVSTYAQSDPFCRLDNGKIILTEWM